MLIGDQSKFVYVGIEDGLVSTNARYWQWSGYRFLFYYFAP